MSIPYPKGGGGVLTCVKDHIIDEKRDYKYIGLRGFDYKLFEEEYGGENREELDEYPYLKHLIQFWPGDWVKYMAKMNEAVGMNNRFTMDEGGKQTVLPFRRQEFCKFVGCVLWTITYGKRGHKL